MWWTIPQKKKKKGKKENKQGRNGLLNVIWQQRKTQLWRRLLNFRVRMFVKSAVKTRFQFPYWVMKNVLFPKVITIFKLIYLFWFTMKQTLPGFCVTRFTSAFASATFSARFPGVVLLGWDNLFIPRHFQRLITGKLTGVDPGRSQTLQRIKVEVTSWAK